MEAPALNSSESKGAGWRGETLRQRAGDDDLCAGGVWGVDDKNSGDRGDKKM